MCPAAEDDFVICRNACMDMCLCSQADSLAKLYDHIRHTFTVNCGKSKTLSFATSIIKNFAVFAGGFRARFPVKLTSYNALRSASSACCLLKSIAINLEFSLK